MSEKYYQAALDSEEEGFAVGFPPESHYPIFFRLAVNLAGDYYYGSVAMAAKPEDYCQRCKSLAVARDTDGSTLDAGTVFFLIPQYDWETIVASVTRFFDLVKVGDNLHELRLKSYCLFSDEAFWEDYPPRIDMSQPSLPYQYKIIGMSDEVGNFFAWEHIPDGFEILRRMDICIELDFETVIKQVFLRLHPIEDFYAWIMSQEAPRLIFAGDYGLHKIRKQKTNALIQDFFDHFEGSSVEEIALRWAVVAHVPDLTTLLQTPLSAGGPFSLEPIGIQIGRAKIRNSTNT